MESRRYLRPEEEDGGRYRIDGLLAAGRTQQIVRCEDTERGGRAVCAKAPLFDRYDDPEVREARRRSLAFEAELLREDHRALPMFVDHLEIEVDDHRVPVLVYEHVDGEPVLDFVAKRPREVLGERELLAVLREVGEALGAIHEAGYLFRDLDPRHVLVADGTFTGFVGTGNVVAMGEPPLRPSSDYAEAPYVAPESRQERSGETMRPAADVYGLGALASYLFTGEEPTSAVESPLQGRAYELLQHVEPAGLRRLVAAGLQPVAKHRVDLGTFVERAEMDRLPGEDEPLVGDESVRDLPPPWSGARPPGENRAARSNLSAGPLISVSREDDADSASTPEPDPAVESPAVREFMGERDEVGGESAEDRGDDRGSGANEGDGESDDVRRREDGAPAREVSMVDENLERGGDGAAPDPDPAGDELPALDELPLGTRVLIGVVLPLAVMFTVITLGLLGVI